jgi:hypothetical protein
VPEYWWVAGLALVAAAGWLTSVLIAVRQVRNERRARTSAEHRAQAERVSGWPEPRANPQPVALLNRSDEPVYDAVATFVFIDGSGPARGEDISPSRDGWRIRVGVIPPGRLRVCANSDWNGMYPRLGIEVAFTDRAGAHWVRRADGRLEQLPCCAFEYFHFSRQLDLTPPERDEAPEVRLDHRARVSSFSLGNGLGRRWSARCACGWLVTTASHPAACDEFARHHRAARESVAWRVGAARGRAAA